MADLNFAKEQVEASRAKQSNDKKDEEKTQQDYQNQVKDKSSMAAKTQHLMAT